MTTDDFPANGPRARHAAFTAAAARAAHLLVDAESFIFSSTLAATLLDDRAEELLACQRLHGARPVLAGARAEAVRRSRFTENGSPAPILV